MSRHTTRLSYEDLKLEIWDLRNRLERAKREDRSRDVVSAQAYLAAARELHERLDDALDDLPRYVAVTQPENGWLPGDALGPTMRTCVYVDDVREMLRRQCFRELDRLDGKPEQPERFSATTEVEHD